MNLAANERSEATRYVPNGIVQCLIRKSAALYSNYFKGVFNIFMIGLNPSPLRWIRANDPNWVRLFWSMEGLVNFVRFLKGNRELRNYVTDVGSGSIVKAIMQMAYKSGAR